MFAPGNVVQMHMYAFDAAVNCANNGTTCSLQTFFVPGTSVPRPGNVHVLLQATLVPASGGLSVSSFNTYPIQSMANSLGYQIWICFVDQGAASTNTAVLAAQLQSDAIAGPCQFPAVFPARVSF